MVASVARTWSPLLQGHMVDMHEQGVLMHVVVESTLYVYLKPICLGPHSHGGTRDFSGTTRTSRDRNQCDRKSQEIGRKTKSIK